MAFGLRPGATPDRLLVGLPALSLLSEASDDQALLCVADDTTWPDKAFA
jgi:hypothetical protein